MIDYRNKFCGDYFFEVNSNLTVNLETTKYYNEFEFLYSKSCSGRIYQSQGYSKKIIGTEYEINFSNPLNPKPYLNDTPCL
jgi:hypothetical protein